MKNVKKMKMEMNVSIEGKLMAELPRNQGGITGLETAIILIAFVVVAAVFAYTVLSAGLFSTQKSSEAVYAGLQETRSTLQLEGGIILRDSDNNNYVDQVDLTLRLAVGGEPVNFTPRPDDASVSNKVIVSYQDSSQSVSDLCWTLTKLGHCDSDNILEEGETFQVTIPRLESGTVNALNPRLGTKTTFDIFLKPPQGAALSVERTTPREIDPVMNMN